MTIISRSKPTRKDRLRLIASGVQKEFPSGTAVFVGQTFNMPVDLVNLIQADIDVTDAADKARADWLVAVQAQRDSHKKVDPVLRALKRQVLAQSGDTQSAGAKLAAFGWSPPTVTAKTAATKAAAAEKGKATRAARHTMGKNQKKDVKGDVQVAIVVTPDGGSTPTPTPAPTGGSPPAASPGSAPAGTTPAGTATHS